MAEGPVGLAVVLPCLCWLKSVASITNTDAAIVVVDITVRRMTSVYQSNFPCFESDYVDQTMLQAVIV